MKKLLLLSLMAALPMVALSASTQVTAQLRVIDPASEVYLDLSSTSAAFGNVLIKPGKVDLATPISITLGGTNVARAHIAVPKTIQLSSGENHIDVTTKLTGTRGCTLHALSKQVILFTDTTLSETTDNHVTGELSASITLAGTEQPGRYHGVIPVYATYN